mmetsp:Transcript_24862/g.40418  ORF Transcript_24862/g.40418 Transcript_24862/m.40418 type:complete len:201 (-) Transcript_24862:18-620(-)
MGPIGRIAVVGSVRGIGRCRCRIKFLHIVVASIVWKSRRNDGDYRSQIDGHVVALFQPDGRAPEHVVLEKGSQPHLRDMHPLRQSLPPEIRQMFTILMEHHVLLKTLGVPVVHVDGDQQTASLPVGPFSCSSTPGRVDAPIHPQGPLLQDDSCLNHFAQIPGRKAASQHGEPLFHQVRLNKAYPAPIAFCPPLSLQGIEW